MFDQVSLGSFGFVTVGGRWNTMTFLLSQQKERLILNDREHSILYTILLKEESVRAASFLSCSRPLVP